MARVRYLFARCGVLFNGEAGPSRREVLERYIEYAARAQSANWEEAPLETTARAILTPLTGLFHLTAAGPRWRRALTTIMQDRPALLLPVESLVRRALSEVDTPGLAEILDERPSLKLHKSLSTGDKTQAVVATAAGLAYARAVRAGALHEAAAKAAEAAAAAELANVGSKRLETLAARDAAAAATAVAAVAATTAGDRGGRRPSKWAGAELASAYESAPPSAGASTEGRAAGAAGGARAGAGTWPARLALAVGLAAAAALALQAARGRGVKGSKV